MAVETPGALDPANVDKMTLQQVVETAQARTERQSKLSIMSTSGTTDMALIADPALKAINTYGNQPAKLNPPSN